MERPHLVILGAGASRAACPRGDRSGRPLPLMADFSKCLGLDEVLRSWGVDQSANFEDVYSGLHKAGRLARIIHTVEFRAPSFEHLASAGHT